MVFGAQGFSFWSDRADFLPAEIRSLQASDADYRLLREENRFCIKIAWAGTLYGIVDVSGFLFTQYIDKYLNLAVEVAKITGLVFHNNDQYETILASEKELKYLSYHDTMTGLFNRTYMNQILAEPVRDRVISAFVFDIDKLKYVNDHYGHGEGDKLICSFAEVLKRSFRETYMVARIGGDEFVAIVYDSDDESCKAIIQRISELIRLNNETIQEKHLQLSVSMGCALAQKEAETIEALIQRADEEMYADKAAK